MHGIVKFLIVLLRSLLLFFCTVLLSEVDTRQCHAQICRSIGQPSGDEINKGRYQLPEAPS